MSQVNSYDREQYATNGVTKTFSFGWNVNSKEDIHVKFCRADGVIVNSATFIDSNNQEYTTSAYAYVVELNRQGGTITFNDTPKENQNLIIYRETPLVYENSFKTATAFPAAAIDAAYSKIWLALQEVQSDAEHNTVRMTANQRGLTFAEFSNTVNNHLVYYNNMTLHYTSFTTTDVANAIYWSGQVPQALSDASEALNKAGNAITIANGAKTVAEQARDDAAAAIQTANNAYGIANTALQPGDDITQLVNNANYQTLADMTAALTAKQDVLVSGTNIKTVNGNSLLGSGNVAIGAEWGNITGTLSDQTDLQSALNAKQDTLTAGTNITITSNIISATDTTYTGSDGITLTGTNFTNSGVRSVASGTANGTISVDTNGTAADVSVTGLGSAAYTASSAYDIAGAASTAETNAKNYADSLASNYATAAQGALADTAVQPSDNVSVLVNDAKYLANTATATDAISVYGTANTTWTNGINIGVGSRINSTNGIAIGVDASADVNAVGVGRDADAGVRGTAIGAYAKTSADTGIAIGCWNSTMHNAVSSAKGAYQFGVGTNSTARTLNVGWYDDSVSPSTFRNYQVLDGNTGLIPDARISTNIARTSALPSVMTGATAADAGTSGLVPAPAAGDQAKFLQGDGTWANPTATTAWGNITGTLSSQTDLQNALNAKQDNLTAGSGISISSNTVSISDIDCGTLS